VERKTQRHSIKDKRTYGDAGVFHSHKQVPHAEQAHGRRKSQQGTIDQARVLSNRNSQRKKRGNPDR